MNETVLHRCAVVNCETSGCGMLLVLEVIDKVDPSARPMAVDILKRCREFLEVCPECNQSHTYGRADVRVELLPNISAPIGFCSEAFAAATEPELPEIV